MVRTQTLRSQTKGSPSASRGIEHLEQAYSALEGEVGVRSAFESLLELIWYGVVGQLPDGAKLSKEKADSYAPLLKEWFKGYLSSEHICDDIGVIMEVRAMETFDGAGQYLSPMNLCLMMAMIVHGDEAEFRARHASLGQPVQIVEPACGTGRMLLAAMEVAGPWGVPMELLGADLDMRMVRATQLNIFLGNLWLRAQGHPFLVPGCALWANALEVELGLKRTWADAGRWVQPHWSTLPARGSGAVEAVAPTGLYAFDADAAPQPSVAPVETVEERRARRPAAAKQRRDSVVAPPDRKAGRQARLGEE